MLSGFYTISSGMLASQRNIDTIGSNLLNIQTPGYRGERVINSAFEQELMTRREKNKSGGVLGDGVGATAAIVDDVLSSFTEGTIKPTGRTLDAAINGEGFFNVTGEDGKNYLTRNGNFSLDKDGYLVLPGVGKLVSDNGNIKVASSNITFLSDGTVQDEKGVSLGKLVISSPADYTTLERTTDGLFTSAQQVPVSQNFQLIQNNLELSNIDMNVELTSLVAAQRSFQNCSSALKTIDALNRKATQIAAV
ncbi:MAG: flagellar hook basal-body protein [Oscillospiraceae bacterium]